MLLQKYFPELSVHQLNQFEMLLPLYEEWNAQINVISRKDMEHFYEHHVLHSLAIAKLYQFEKDMQVMDLGSGGGFPGIPLAIMFPDVKFLLVDSIAKKMKVAAAVAEATGLKNISTAHARAEDIRHTKFDAVVSRAVAPLATLLSWCKPVLKNNSPYGLVCLKGGNLDEEINACPLPVITHPVSQFFDEPFFAEKYIIQVK